MNNMKKYWYVPVVGLILTGLTIFYTPERMASGYAWYGFPLQFFGTLFRYRSVLYFVVDCLFWGLLVFFAVFIVGKTKKKNKLLKASMLIFLISILFLGVIVISTMGRNFIFENFNFAKPHGAIKTGTNDKLQSNINTFMESQVGENDLGKKNYHCGNILSGYDDKYAYAWVVCQGFIVDHGIIRDERTGYSIPTRLEYQPDDFQIVNFKQPRDSNYVSDERQLFPKQFFNRGEIISPSSVEFSKMNQELRDKANDTEVK